jgi:hypothetical protein
MSNPNNQEELLRFANRVREVIVKSPGSDDYYGDAYNNPDFYNASTWAIICQEMLDTEFPKSYFQSAKEELYRRGITDEEILEMRFLAWVTAGWLNFIMMLWDWCNLDENDMRSALDWQLKDGWITETEMHEKLRYMEKYLREIDHPVPEQS